MPARRDEALPQHPQHRRDGCEDRGTATKLISHHLAREPRHENETGTGQQGEQAYPDTEDEGQLQGDDHHIVAAQVQLVEPEPRLREHGDLAGKLRVTQDHALGLSGAARGEQDKGRAGQQIPSLRRSAGNIGKFTRVDREACLRHLPQTAYRGGRCRPMHGHGDGAGQPDAEENGEILGSVGDRHVHGCGRANVQSDSAAHRARRGTPSSL